MHRTFRGRRIDMRRVAEAHGDTPAVTGSSARLNARGDLLGRGGRVAVPVQMRSNPEAQVARAVAVGGTPRLRPDELNRVVDTAFADPAEVQRRAREEEARRREEARQAAEQAATEAARRAAEAKIAAEQEAAADDDAPAGESNAAAETEAGAEGGGRGNRRRRRR